ncbi:hypothetical protein IV01_13400 [Pseudomonas syringae]|uniref:Uncharacterized protein n=1 Tax=Pseudomonas syringae TaxID=317 RepID=A0A085VIC6_PSESX|nr:hypothetical protein IV01_13400 [Pseudomonas syringae]
MSKWQARREKILADSDYDDLITIPMLEEKAFCIDDIIRNISHHFAASHATHIVIADPYLEETDIELVLRMFGGHVGRTITIITNLSNHSKLYQKLESAKTLKKVITDIDAREIFKSINICKTNMKFHDRFIFSFDEGRDGLLLWCGTSLNQFMQNYGSLIKISNKAFKRQIVKFINAASDDGHTLEEYIRRNS